MRGPKPWVPQGAQRALGSCAMAASSAGAAQGQGTEGLGGGWGAVAALRAEFPDLLCFHGRIPKIGF